MAEKRNHSNLYRQHVEMEAFFVGDFTRRSAAADTSADSQPKLTLEDIAAKVEACRKCDIGSTRLHPVAGEGNPRARLVFIGEAPGAEEDQQGRPFVGRAGQLLTKMITAMGLRREDVFICNILKCHPLGNRDPKLDEALKCLPFLKQQIEIIQPEVIVALGAHAAHILLETEKQIGKLRGQWYDFYFSESSPPAKLMPTYHPAYLLRYYSYENRKRVWDDLQKVCERLGLETILTS
jgi:DNA polymerase